MGSAVVGLAVVGLAVVGGAVVGLAVFFAVGVVVGSSVAKTKYFSSPGAGLWYLDEEHIRQVFPRHASRNGF